MPSTEGLERDVVSTDLVLDVVTRRSRAVITLAPGESPIASLEVGDLDIADVRRDGVRVPFAHRNERLDFDLETRDTATIEVDYVFHFQTGLRGADPAGFTFTFPDCCGNLFPCRSETIDGATLTAELTGVPPGYTAIYPHRIPADAPSYMFAWALGDYEHVDLGATAAGTDVSVWFQRGERSRALEGARHLVAAFDWMERTIGPYRFGGWVGSVSVRWPRGTWGGMEHHPFWHIASRFLDEESFHVHEAAHGWFGNGVRIACWEDFVLSEGTVTYLTARALEVVAPSSTVWPEHELSLERVEPGVVWPATRCSAHVIHDHLTSYATYMRGAFFYRALALRVGAEALDRALAAFYREHAGSAASMDDMLLTIREETGYDPSACANTWLREPTVPPVAACP